MSTSDATEWKEAIDSELESLKKHGTWEVVAQPDGVKVLPTRFVFICKHGENGKVIRHKARIVVRCFLEGDVEQTFDPVVDFATVRTCLAVALQKGYSVQQLDVPTAFLHGEIDNDVYIKPPRGVEFCEEGQVLKLQRGLYGLKQAPCFWHEKWELVMDKMEFVTLLSDACVYRREGVWLLLYVDDIIAIGLDDKQVCAVKLELMRYLDVKDMRNIGFFLGVMFMRDGNGAWLSKKHYISEVFERFGMSPWKAVVTPMCDGALQDFSEEKEVHSDRQSYQERLGCLLFISTRTRPDISAAVSILCWYAFNLMQAHWTCLKRILRYLQGTIDFALRI